MAQTTNVRNISAVWLVFAILAGAAIAAPTANAHPQKLAQTEVLLNTRSGFLEVAHRITLHDAEDAIATRTGVRPDLLNDAAARAGFAEEVARAFAMQDGRGDTIVFELLGVEVVDGRLWVYQQAERTSLEGPLAVQQAIFTDVWPDQRTLVTVDTGAQKVSGVFTPDLPEQVLELMP